ncbi:MAG: phosphoserine phosphatase SerB [Pseudomonadota bacterium]|nr:phosphoserine phosphatase SerB [Pseudomonadota bacterium]
MRLVFTLVAGGTDALQDALQDALDAVVAAGRPIGETAILGEGAADIFVEGDGPLTLRGHARQALARHAVDHCVQPAAGRRKRLLVADMDSTIIGCECLDELAKFAGVGAEVAAITARAMAGEIAFEGALRERVAMLAGVELGLLQRVFDESVRLTPGAATLARTMAAHGARCVLVSGGFEFFTRRVTEAAGFATHRANRLIDDGARLTGAVGEPILGRAAKLAALVEEAAALGIDLSQTLAVGDGANDLAMIEAAGLGVAWRARPIVAAKADARIDHADLTALLYFQGYGADTFVRRHGIDNPPAP